MVQANELIYVNNFGISKVVSVDTNKVSISPLYGTSGIIIMNCESTNMRPLVTRDEINEILLRVKDEQTHWISKFITRNDVYSDIKKHPDPFKRLLMCKTIFNRHKYRKEKKMKGSLSTRDLEFFHRSLDLVTYEFANVLGIKYSDVAAYIASVWNDNIIFEYYKL